MAVTRETAQFLLGLLGQVTLSAGAPDFAESAAAIVKARAELEAVLSNGQVLAEAETQDV